VTGCSWRTLPLVSGSLLAFMGRCVTRGVSWEQCKLNLREEFFPHFVRERLIRDLIMFNFHRKDEALRVYADRVFAAAKFLGYEATELQLLEHIIMNLHPSISAQAAFLDRPRSRAELNRVICLIEERFSVMKGRERIQNVHHPSGGGKSRPRDNPSAPPLADWTPQVLELRTHGPRQAQLPT
jgi:hypothetical protein